MAQNLRTSMVLHWNCQLTTMLGLQDMGAPVLMRSPGLYYIMKKRRGTGPYRNSVSVRQDAQSSDQ